MPSQPSDIHKILVVTLSNMGDVVLTLPVMQSLLRAYPAAKLHVMVGPQSAVVFQDDARVEKVIAYNKRVSFSEKWRLLWQVRQERYDLIIDLRRSLFGFLGGARLRNDYFLFPKNRMHRALRHLEALKGLVEPALDGSFLRVRPDALRSAEVLLAGTENFVAAAVGSKADIKKWPAESYAKLLDRLSAAEGLQIVLVGDAQDMPQAQKVQESMRTKTLDLTGRTSFAELSAILSRAALVVTNDSAPLHIADALETPVLAIFGPTDPGKYGPRASTSAAVSKKLFCGPCEKAQCRFHHECMTELGVDTVYREAQRILRGTPRADRPRILISRLDRIGDVIVSIPAIEAVRKQFPHCHLTVLTRPSTKPLLEGHPAIDEVFSYDYEKKGRHSGLLGSIRFIREVVQRRFDIAFILHPSNRAYWVPFLAGIPYRIGLRTQMPFLLTKAVPDRRREGLKHEADYTMDIVRAFGVSAPPDRSFFIPVFYEEQISVDQKLKAAGISGAERPVALHPGASCASKRWPVERFEEFAAQVLARRDERIIIVGGIEEKKMGEALQLRLGPRVIDWTGQLSLKELAALFKRCSALVSNDSGPVHIAAATGLPTLTIFGRNKADLGPVRWRALGPDHTFIQKDVGCAVCLAHRCTIEFECLKAVSVDEVFEKLDGMLSGLHQDRVPV